MRQKHPPEAREFTNASLAKVIGLGISEPVEMLVLDENLA
jgi:hypothetical protein